MDFFFKINFSKKISGIPSECQNSLDLDQRAGLIWVQVVCKGYQQMTKVATSRERINLSLTFLSEFGAACKWATTYLVFFVVNYVHFHKINDVCTSVSINFVDA